jgi:hypothetical protein
VTLSELLALFPDNTTGQIGADDMRTTVAELFRPDWHAADHGLLAWSYDPVTCSGGGSVTSGTLYFQRLHLTAQASITNVVMYAATAGSGLTAGQNIAALYDGAGALIAVTADQASAWASTGLKVMPLVGGPYVCQAGDYQAAFWSVGTTPVGMNRGSANAGASLVNIGRMSPSLRMGTADTGLTTTAPPMMGAQASSAGVGWMALS